jgi:hypothetical protein
MLASPSAIPTTTSPVDLSGITGTDIGPAVVDTFGSHSENVAPSGDTGGGNVVGDDVGIKRGGLLRKRAGGIAHHMAGGGEINLHGTLQLGDGNQEGLGGQFGKARPNGYQSAGSGGFDPRAVAANPQGFQAYLQQMRMQEMRMPGSTMFGMGYANGGISTLGSYSDGGRLLRGPGDGVSDSIPATIANKRPARLADGEFVVPARIVSELGNGSTEAGARKLYAMMDRIQRARRKTTGKGKVAVNSRAEKLLPA